MNDSEPFFGPGQRVEVWDGAAREWGPATIRYVYFNPALRMPNGDYVAPEVRYQVTYDGRDDPRQYRAAELRPVR